MIKLAFILFTNLSVGAGTESIILEYCQRVPSDFEITVVQMDKPTGKLEYREKLLSVKNVNLITVKGYDYKFSYVAKNEILEGLHLFLFQPFLFKLLHYTVYRDLQKQIGNQDIIYVVQNNYSSLFKKGPIIIGSTHCWRPIRSGPKSIFTKFIYHRIFWRNINFFHIYTHYSWFLSHSRGFIVDNGIDLSIFSSNTSKKFEEEKKSFVFMARLEECKGVNIAINAFLNLKRDDINLNIIGNGSLFETIKEEKHIKKIGFLEKPEINKIFARSGCLVYPSTCDTFSLVVIEALGSGLYVIASNYLKGIFDEFEQLGVLEYCDPNPIAFSERMKVYLNKTLDVSAFDKAKELVKKKYSWDFLCKKFYNELRDIVINKNHDKKEIL